MENQDLTKNKACGFLLEGERFDDLELNGLYIIQHSKKFCFGIDAVLLSSFARVEEGEEVLDIGTGTGIIPILLSAKTRGRHFTGIELQEESADMAKRSVSFNGLSDRIEIICGDIRDSKDILPSSHFEAVLSNPPYIEKGKGLISGNREKDIARHELFLSFGELSREASRVLKVNGRFYIIHRPQRLAELFRKLSDNGLEPKRIRFVLPSPDREPTMVLIEAIKGAKSGLIVEKPLLVYEEGGRYTDEILEIYGKKQRE